MSGLYLTAAVRDDVAAVAERLVFTAATESSHFRDQALAGAVTRADGLATWGAAEDPASGVRVVLGGRLALPPAARAAAAELPFQGGLAAKAVLAAWHERGAGLGGWLNGAFAVAVFERRERTLHVFTDRMGVCPLFQATRGPLRLCSHPDVLAEALAAGGAPPSLDLTTLAELLGTERSVHPYTYYREIRQLDPGSHYAWRLEDGAPPAPTQREYWSPAYRERPPQGLQTELIEELAAAVQEAVRLRVAGVAGRPALLLSGGVDSRGLLFALPEPARADCITFYDQANTELATARALAEAAGAVHHAWQRDPEFYGRPAAETARISGGMSSFMHGHTTGFLQRLSELAPPVLLTGCFADLMFKGLALNRGLGRKLSIARLAAFDHAFYGSHHRLAEPYQRAVGARLAEQMRGIDTSDYQRTALLVEERRLRPLSRQKTFAFRSVLLRTAPWECVLVDNGLLDIYGRMSVESKINGVVFKRALARLCAGQAGHIRDSNDGARLGAGALERTLASLVTKGYYTLSGVGGRRKVATSGSWINFQWYVAHSPVVRELWADPTPAERELFTTLLAYDPWSRTLAEWSQAHFQFGMLLTARLWLRQRGLP